jgi:hypothetical protein
MKRLVPLLDCDECISASAFDLWPRSQALPRRVGQTDQAPDRTDCQFTRRHRHPPHSPH